MSKNSISRYVQQNWKSLVYLAIILISVPIMIIPITKSGINVFAGIILFFYAFNQLLQRPVYYIILGVISLLLLIFEFKGDDIFKTMNLLSHLGEDLAFGLAFFLIAGIIASIVGIARWRKYD
jgi:hypothetical protein